MATLNHYVSLQSLCSNARANNKQHFCMKPFINRKTFQCSNPLIKNPSRKLKRKNKQLMMVSSLPNDCFGDLSSYSQIIIESFFDYINNKDFNSLEAILSEHCIFEDISSKEVVNKKMDFLKLFILAMGENVEIEIEFPRPLLCSINEEAGAIWHLNWKDKKIPFTRCSSTFQFTESRDKLLLREVQVLITQDESLMKREALSMLALFASMTTLLDTYPWVANILLKLPEDTLLPYAAILTTLFDLYPQFAYGMLRRHTSYMQRSNDIYLG